jgi:hypothetical protein
VVELLADENEPASHIVQAEEPLVLDEKVPGSHTVHEVEDDKFVDLDPAGHTRQPTDAFAAEKVPAGQLEHSVRELPLEYVPG